MMFLLNLIPARFHLLVKVIAGAILLLAIWYVWRQFTGHYIDIGRAEVQAKWDKETKRLAEERDKQIAENIQKSIAAASAKQRIFSEHQAEVAKLRSQSNAKLQNSLADTDAIWRDRLRNAVGADRARTVSELSSSAEGITESGGDGHATVTRSQYDTLEAACKLTTIDYNALRKSWDEACLVYGCEP
jgi:hypothetical protein